MALNFKTWKLCNMSMPSVAKDFVIAQVVPGLAKLFVNHDYILKTYGFRVFLGDPVISNEVLIRIAYYIKISITQFGLNVDKKFEPEIAALTIRDYAEYVLFDNQMQKIIIELCTSIKNGKITKDNYQSSLI